MHMEIRIKADPTLEEFRHANLLLAGRTGIYKFLHPAILFLFLICALTVMVFTYITGMASVGLPTCSVILIMVAATAFVQYFVFPRRIQKAYTQAKNFSGQPEFRFTDTGVTHTDQNGESIVPWGKYAYWLEDEKVLALFPTDFTIHLIPKRCASAEQWAEIRGMIAGAKIPVRKTNRLATLIVAALLLMVILPINCLLLFRLALYFLQPSPGA
ncbi:MAG: YcxB family protein [Anaerolineales bacterium]|nr:YcxB family protein [Anaerolineales bacterium]